MLLMLYEQQAVWLFFCPGLSRLRYGYIVVASGFDRGAGDGWVELPPPELPVAPPLAVVPSFAPPERPDWQM